MSKHGRAKPSLTESLQATVARQREAHQAAMQKELETLEAGLRQSSTAALAGLERDIKRQLGQIQSALTQRVTAMDWELTEIRDRPRRMILLSATVAAITSAIFWAGPMLWTNWTLSGATLSTGPQGTFLILPGGAETGWTCGETPCVKLEE